MGRRQSARSARAALWWGVVGFAVGQVLLGAAVDQAVPAVRDADYVRRLGRLRARRAAAPGAPLVVALGSSRTACGFRAGRLRPVLDGRPGVACNFGRPGAGPMVQLALLRRLLADGQRPDAVLVEFLPLYFNDRPGRLEDEKWLEDNAAPRYSAREIHRLSRYCKSPADLVWRWGLARGLPCVRQLDDLREWSAGAGPPADEDAADGALVPVADVTPEQRRRYTAAVLGDFARGGAFDAFRLAPQPAAALHDLLALCRRDHVRARLILMPETGAFRAAYSADMTAATAAYLAGLRRDWGVTTIDARQWVPDEGFSDGHHLLPAGGALFTDRLGRVLDADGWPDAP
jgi:hypothetical protein